VPEHEYIVQDKVNYNSEQSQQVHRPSSLIYAWDLLYCFVLSSTCY